MVYDLGCYCTTMLLTLTEDEPEMVKAVAEFTDEGVEYNQQGEISYEITTPEGTITRKLTVPHNYTLEAENLSLSILGKATPKVTPEFSVKNAEFIDKVLEEIGW